ncbi:MAG: hypothetical protein IPL72_04245 [Sulfuritalea sp.]|nr:hypothetical protein [Sulfuritalea sp.]
MADALLTLNAGSSSIRFARFECHTPIPRQPGLVGQIDGIGAAGSRVAALASAALTSPPWIPSSSR